MSDRDSPQKKQPIVFIAPRLDGPPTGGTLYNRNVLSALQAHGVNARAVDFDDAKEQIGTEPGLYVFDSLYLDSFGELRKENQQERPLWLLAHYLPSLVRLGRACSWSELLPAEREALSTADGIVTTGAFVRDMLGDFSELDTPVVCVEPGISEPTRYLEAHAIETSTPVSAIVVGALTEEKGVLPFLRELRHYTQDDDHWHIDVVGSTIIDTAYAAACRQVVSAHPLLSRSVDFREALPHAETLELIGSSHVFLSTSRMESFGMALSEARAAGVPVLALNRGNAAQHADPDAGSEPFDDVESLTCAFLGLVRDKSEMARRMRLAKSRVPQRGWHRAAIDFVSAVGFEQSSHG